MDSNRACSESIGRIKSFLLDLDEIFGVFCQNKEDLTEDVDELIKERELARSRKDYGRSDEIRDQLLKRGIVLEDTKQGIRWRQT